jgi:hypothetical protein
VKILAAVLVVGGFVGFFYGLFDLVLPTTALRWQANSTSRAKKWSRAIGLAFQRMVGVTGPSEPAIRGSRAEQRVRVTGIVLITLSLLEVAVGIWVATG